MIILRKKPDFLRVLSCLILLSFLSGQASLSSNASAQNALLFPPPGVMVTSTSGFMPALIKGIKIHPDNPLRMDFIIDTGSSGLTGQALKSEGQMLIKYFLASLTTPSQDVWVNLSPHEKDRIVPEAFGQTDMGRDLLAQDYLLKQFTASLLYPEKFPGKEFWRRVHESAEGSDGRMDPDMDTFNKIWIVPDKAVVYEHEDVVFVAESRLKVMLERDYVAMQNDHVADSFHSMPSAADDQQAVYERAMREVIIPEVQREVNTGQHFAKLRQIYHAMILATWYKRNLRTNILGAGYADRNKIQGIDLDDKTVKEKIYAQYLTAFEQGVYNYIKEEPVPGQERPIPRHYFSGGFDGRPVDNLTGKKVPPKILWKTARPVEGGDLYTLSTDMAVISEQKKTQGSQGAGENPETPEESDFEHPGPDWPSLMFKDLVERYQLSEFGRDQVLASYGDSRPPLIYQKGEQDYFLFAAYDSKQLVVIQTGPLLMMRREFYERLSVEDRTKYKDRIAVMPDFDALFEYGEWAVPLILEMASYDMTGFHLVDSGAGQGILALIGLKLGAGRVYLADKDTEALKKARQLLELNGYEEGAHFDLRSLDLQNKRAVRVYSQKISREAGENGKKVVVVSNIGVWPDMPATNINSMEFLRHIPEAELFIAGGYTPRDWWQNKEYIEGDIEMMTRVAPQFIAHSGAFMTKRFWDPGDDPIDIIYTLTASKDGMHDPDAHRKTAASRPSEGEQAEIGGINLDEQLLDLETQGQGLDFGIPVNGQDFEMMLIDGVRPVIFEVTPTNISNLLGLSEQEVSAGS